MARIKKMCALAFIRSRLRIGSSAPGDKCMDPLPIRNLPLIFASPLPPPNSCKRGEWPAALFDLISSSKISAVPRQERKLKISDLSDSLMQGGRRRKGKPSLLAGQQTMAKILSQPTGLGLRAATNSPRQFCEGRWRRGGLLQKASCEL